MQSLIFFSLFLFFSLISQSSRLLRLLQVDEKDRYSPASPAGTDVDAFWTVKAADDVTEEGPEDEDTDDAVIPLEEDVWTWLLVCCWWCCWCCCCCCCCWWLGVFLDGEVLLEADGGCLSALVGTSPSGGGSTCPGATSRRTWVHSAVFMPLMLLPFSNTSTCWPFVTVNSLEPGAAEWSAMTHVTSATPVWNNPQLNRIKIH